MKKIIITLAGCLLLSFGLIANAQTQVVSTTSAKVLPSPKHPVLPTIVVAKKKCPKGYTFGCNRIARVKKVCGCKSSGRRPGRKPKPDRRPRPKPMPK